MVQFVSKGIIRVFGYSLQHLRQSSASSWLFRQIAELLPVELHEKDHGISFAWTCKQKVDYYSGNVEHAGPSTGAFLEILE
jgi:hypothetical protein